MHLMGHPYIIDYFVYRLSLNFADIKVINTPCYKVINHVIYTLCGLQQIIANVNTSVTFSA